MPHALRVNLENFGPTTKNLIFRLVKLLAYLSTRPYEVIGRVHQNNLIPDQGLNSFDSSAY